MKYISTIFFLLTILLFINCYDAIAQKVEKKKQFIAKHSNNNHCSAYDHCPAQFDLKDSLMLKHVKNQFYRSSTGHLYERTKAQKENPKKITFVEYFNGYFSQEVDPYTFKELDGWYAKDKNFVYYYRPTSGGMQILKLQKADVKTFKILAGHYKYASDKNYFYDETDIIEGFKPIKTTFKYDKKKRVKEMTSGNKKYSFETVDN